ncbi:ribosomal protein L33 [Pneumocystis murina B123]|uniref:Large ribosomal subunit protein bL33m n=1 Tax=Pneumocystis murina (strain B123) TaxID=1069680 RepID=M7P6H3_PNEMU|nr:ribosomal protein L33 [Pneumocystis murina B123]EMR09475.1 ribosomal protein L33 [Pneumocystis murina B123]
MAKKPKSRIILVKLLSTVGTGWFYTANRPRLSPKLSCIKFDPRVNKRVLFEEVKIK